MIWTYAELSKFPFMEETGLTTIHGISIVFR